MKYLSPINTTGLLLFALLAACGDDDGVVITEVDAGARASSDSRESKDSDGKPVDSDDSGTSGSPIADEGDASAPGDETDLSPDASSQGNDVTSGNADAAVTDDVTEPAEPENSMYVVAASVNDGNAWLTYLATSPTLKTHIKTDDAIEIPGRALAVGPHEAGVTYVTSGTTITRYRFDEKSGSLKSEEPTISFAGLGVTDIHEYGGQFVFEGMDKSYFFDGDNSQVVIWNPEELTLDRAIPLDIVPEELDGVILTYSAAPIRKGDQIVTFAGLRQGTAPVSLAAVVVLDTKTDTAEVVTDDRCGYVRDGVWADDGFIYLATEAYAAAYHRVQDDKDAPVPCLLRFDPKTKRFDEDFHVGLSSLFQGAAAGSLLVAKDGSAYLKVLDEKVQSVDGNSVPRLIASQPAWRWASLTVGDEPAAKVLDLPHTSGSVTPFSLGSQRFALTNRSVDHNGRTITVSDISELNSKPSEVVGTVDGLVFSITKVR